MDPEEGEAVPASLQKLYGGPDIRSKLCMKGSVPTWELEMGGACEHRSSGSGLINVGPGASSVTSPGAGQGC